MRLIALSLFCLTLVSMPVRADDLNTCEARRVELSRQAEKFTGEVSMKRLIEADLKRARKELDEGDADECIEALDHAAKLISGQI